MSSGLTFVTLTIIFLWDWWTMLRFQYLHRTSKVPFPSRSKETVWCRQMAPNVLSAELVGLELSLPYLCRYVLRKLNLSYAAPWNDLRLLERFWVSIADTTSWKSNVLMRRATTVIWSNALFPKVLNLLSRVNVLLRRFPLPSTMPFPMPSLSQYPVDHLLKNLGMIIGTKLLVTSNVQRSVGATKLLPKEGVPVQWIGPIAFKKGKLTRAWSSFICVRRLGKYVYFPAAFKS